MKVSLIVDLAGNLQSRARQYAQALTGLSNSGSRAFSGLRNAAASVGRGLDGMGNRYTAMIAGAGITYKATKAVMDSAQLDKNADPCRADGRENPRRDRKPQKRAARHGERDWSIL